MEHRYIPVPTPDTRHFWDGTQRGELLLQKCTACAHTYFPPQPFCPTCGSRKVDVVQASGKATLYSYVISHRDMPEQKAPYVIAVVQLAEGPRMMTNLVGAPPEPTSFDLDMPLELTYLSISEGVSLPQFRPVQEDGNA